MVRYLNTGASNHVFFGELTKVPIKAHEKKYVFPKRIEKKVLWRTPIMYLI